MFSKKSKAGRVLGTLYNKKSDGELVNINQFMIDNKYAKEFNEKK